MENNKINLLTTIADIKEMYGTGREYIIGALNSCYACFLAVKKDPALQAELTKIYAENKFRKQTNTDFASMLIRLTITKSSQKAHPYVKVFRVAFADETSAEGFLDWFESRGGIERIRLLNTPVSNKPTEEQAEAVRKIGVQCVKKQAPLATVNFDNPVNFDNEVALLVVVKTGSSVELVEVLDSEAGVTKAYLSRLGNEQKTPPPQPSSPPQLPSKTQP